MGAVNLKTFRGITLEYLVEIGNVWNIESQMNILKMLPDEIFY